MVSGLALEFSAQGLEVGVSNNERSLFDTSFY